MMAKVASASAVKEDDGPDFSKFLDDLHRTHQSAKTVSEKNGLHRERINKILRDRGFEKTAFGMLRRIDSMSEEKRADFLRTFVAAFQILLEHWGEVDTADLFEGASNVTPMKAKQPDALPAAEEAPEPEPVA